MFPLQSIRFPSGLRVIAERDDRMPLVAVVLVVGAGSSSDPPGKEGLAHYVEHLAFRSRPFGKSSFRRLLERASAGRWNAYTGLDTTVYYELVPAQALPEILRLEGTRMLAAVAQVEPATLGIELDVVRSELRQRNETGIVGELFGSMQMLLFPQGHAYARPVIGTHESLSTLTAEDVAAFLRENYRPSNMTLALVGDVDLDSIQKLVESSLPPALLAASTTQDKPHTLPAQAPEPPSPPPLAVPVVRKEGSVATPELWIAWSLPRSFDTDTYLLNFLKDSLESALSGAEREDGDMVNVSVGLMPGKEASILYCRAVLRSGVDPESSKEHVLNRVYRVWQAEPGVTKIQLAEIEFGNRRRSALVSMLLEAENLISRADARATSTHFSGDPGLYSRGLQSMAKLDIDRLASFGQKYLSRDRARAIFFVPPSSATSPPALLPISAPNLAEPDAAPIGVSVDKLRAIAPRPSVRAYRQFTLPNDLEVIVGKRNGLPITSVSLLFRGGYCDKDRPGTPAAAIASGMMSFPKNKLHGEPEAFGGQWSESLTEQRMSYQITGASGNTAIMIAMLAERVQSMEIDSGAWERFEREYVPFLRARDRNPERIAERAFRSALFGDHAYGCSPTGQEIADVSLSEARTWMNAAHSPERAVLAVVGEIDPDEVERTVRAELGGWGKGEDKEFAPQPPSLSANLAAAPSVAITHRSGATQYQLRFGCILPPARSSAVDVQHDLLAEVVESRLGEILRERLGITYGVHASARVMRGGVAHLEVNGAVEASRLGTTLGVLKETMEELGRAPVPDKEFAWAKLRVSRGQNGRFMANDSIVEAILSARNVGMPIESIEAFADEVFAVKAQALETDARACLQGRTAISIIGDEVTARAAVKQAWP